MSTTDAQPFLRRLIMKGGKRTLRRVGDFQARHSLVGTGPVLDKAEFGWTQTLEEHTEQIKAELEDVLTQPEDIPAFHQLSPDQERISKEDHWKTFAFYVFGHRVDDNCTRCPVTARLLDALPDLQNAWFSILAPRYHIPPHKGPTKAIIRCHLGLRVPAERENCWLRVGDQIRHWREGECLVFDDTYEHEVFNDTDETRVVLFLDFDRPMDALGGLFNRALIRVIRASAYVKDPLKNLAAWNAGQRPDPEHVLIDLRNAESGLSVTADVCIVGAGAAGISLSRHLRKRGHSVCLLESGGLDFEQETQDLYDGPNLGMTYYDLVDSRLRFFGGTTNIWGGRCTPLEPLDFQQRSWVPHSGWPIELKALEDHYRFAHQSLDLGEYAYDEQVWRALGESAPGFDPQRIISRFWRFDTAKERFSAPRCGDLFQDPKVTALLHANVTHLQANSNANGLDHIVASTLDGRRWQVRARNYVLACGGIENPRLLLAARDVQKNGIGNDNDLVGRFFMEHQHGRAGRIHTDDPFRLWHLFRKRRIPRGPPVAPTLLASPTLQQQAGILNTALTFKLQRDPSQGLLLNDRLYRHLKHQLPPDRTRRRLWHAYRDVRGWVQRNLKPKIERLRSGKGERHLYAMVRAEQAPNPNSRVTLSTERDALGVHKASLDWRLSNMDKDTVSVLADSLGEELARLKIGRVEKAEWLQDPSPEWPVDPTVSKHPIGGYHHMGTTRMGSTPATGVVDTDGRVHGYNNLYIAGSSVFPTGGWANPTLTILALVHRLAEHLDVNLKETGGS